MSKNSFLDLSAQELILPRRVFLTNNVADSFYLQYFGRILTLNSSSSLLPFVRHLVRLESSVPLCRTISNFESESEYREEDVEACVILYRFHSFSLWNFTN